MSINEDLIFFEILTRLPVASLLRCKAVCKSWYALISDPSFVVAHLDQSKKRRKLALIPVISRQWMINMYRYEEQDMCFSTFLFRKKVAGEMLTVTHICHSNGLILVMSDLGSFICNPSTRDFTNLPKGGHNYPGCPKPIVRCGFGFVPSSNVLKIAQYFYRSYNPTERNCSIGLEVFTFGVDSSWRVTAKDPPYPIDIRSYPISANGAIYFMIDNNLHKSSPKSILSFDLGDENFTVIPPPFSLSSFENQHVFWTPFSLSSYENLQESWLLTVLEDTLCFLYRPPEDRKFDIWLYKEHTWIHSFTFQLHSGILLPPLFMRDGKLWFRVFYHGMDTLESFDPQSKSFETVAHFTRDYVDPHGRFNLNFLVFSYVESLEPARPKRRRRRRRRRLKYKC